MSTTAVAVVAARAAIPPSVASGSPLGVLVAAWWHRRRSRVEHVGVAGPEHTGSENGVVTCEDREVLDPETVVHAQAVAAGLADYADTLAAGDPLLRSRLRVLEHRMRRRA
ncbi:hypothetical protein [Flexivirga oryzae]|uniref:Uncharacterized protein n=1 Tax=Flexivirga oryzae TaxID=1794944 RepID=A0A839N5Z5_9MICO|nr:hypothetical protein [Flexivirga oryzae]MBB2893168.1 hypothetical protein [Flexivirga oryzae]